MYNQSYSDGTKFASNFVDNNVQPIVILKRAMEHSLTLFVRKRDIWLQVQASK